jgi:hypothetical protein
MRGTIKVGLVVRLAVCVALACVTTACVGVVPASANSPWWHLSVSPRPTYLHPGLARDEVQKLTVEANEGIYGLSTSNGKLAILLVGEAPEQVQRTLEAELYGPGTLKVTAAPGPNGPYEVYTVTFVGGDADQPMSPATIGAPYNVFRKVEGKEVEGNVSVEQVVSGRSDGQIVVTATNLGDAAADPAIEPIELAGKLPAGLKPVAIEGYTNRVYLNDVAFPMECVLASLSCAFTGKNNGGALRLPPYEEMQMRIDVNVKGGAQSGELIGASAAGGGAPSATASKAITVSEAPVPFGLSTYEIRPEEAGGAQTTQAGSHPFQLTTTVGFNETFSGGIHGGVPALAKDLHFELPPGLIGNPTPFAQCTLGDFLHETKCSPETVVGVAKIDVNIPLYGTLPFVVPLFNLVPSVGEPARFAFMVDEIPILLTTAVRTGGDYGVTVSVTNIAERAELLSSEVTFWGVPGDQRHNTSRYSSCTDQEASLDDGQYTSAQLAQRVAEGREGACAPLESLKPPPLLSMPPSCTGGLNTTVEGDSWSEPLAVGRWENTAPMPAMDGCNDLQFNPFIEVVPDGQAGSTPTGLSVKVRVPQEVSLAPNGLAEADVKNTTVTLPAGVAVNPAGADGLQACSEAQVALSSAGPSSCPEASKIGLVKIKTPLLPNELTGSAYLAEQDNNPFGSLIAIYVVAEDPVSGTRVKLAGEVAPNPVTGQLVSTFKNTPELPFETFELHFFGGDRAPLATPGLCGAYTTAASIEPSSSAGSPVQSSSTFDLLSGPNGSACSDPLPFSPSLTGGTTSVQAGGYTPFTMTISRADGQQALSSISLHMPPGISGLLANVKLCPEAQANAGTCSSESEIGETIVSVGVGGDPFSVKGGKVFITEGYEGAPYGLSIVNPAKAGPFDLGNVVVRAKIEVNPITAQLTITTDSSGPYKIPTILDGIPLQIQHVNVTIDRPHFTFNPTNCNPMSITGSLTSAEGATSSLSVPLQVTNCAVLGFKPGFQVSTNGKTSRQSGASLHVKLTYPKAPFGSQANIKSVKVDLPKQLPSNLKTLQKACTVEIFTQNPANCPPESRVGTATATTPLLPVPLAGPAYFVSYGGAQFPELVVVLSGYGTTVDLHGETYINPKTNVTSSTFKTVPDVPVGTFELTLPQGKYAALAAPYGKLCQTKLLMPTAFTAQNGAAIKQNTPIAVTGCPKHKAKAKKAKVKHHKSKRK